MLRHAQPPASIGLDSLISTMRRRKRRAYSKLATVIRSRSITPCNFFACFRISTVSNDRFIGLLGSLKKKLNNFKDVD